MNKQVAIVGYSGHGFVAVEILQLAGYTVIGYCDSEEKMLNPYGLPYLGTEHDFVTSKQATPLFISIGENGIREKVTGKICKAGSGLVNAIHPSSVVSSSVLLGSGVLVAANATISTLCSIGNGVICNTASVIDHECMIENFVHIAPGSILCGHVKVGRRSFIGAGSVVKQGVTICADVLIGAGSCVVKDVTQPGIYFGNPIAHPTLNPH